MEKRIHIFKSFEEQEQFHQTVMKNSTVNERFRKLYEMQQMSLALRPPSDEDKKRKIVIKNGFTQS